MLHTTGISLNGTTHLKEQVIFFDIATTAIEKAGSLSLQNREILKDFLVPQTRRDFRTMLTQAVDLPDECKDTLEGLLFHNKQIRFTLLSMLTNLNEPFERIAVLLNI